MKLKLQQPKASAVTETVPEKGDSSGEHLRSSQEGPLLNDSGSQNEGTLAHFWMAWVAFRMIFKTCTKGFGGDEDRNSLCNESLWNVWAQGLKIIWNQKESLQEIFLKIAILCWNYFINMSKIPQNHL